MLKKLILILAATAALVAQQPAATKKVSALDKATLEVWLRHLFVWPAPIEVSIEDPKPGPMAGFYEVKIRGTSGPQMQDENLLRFEGRPEDPARLRLRHRPEPL